jgi:hypothetical protein
MLPYLAGYLALPRLPPPIGVATPILYPAPSGLFVRLLPLDWQGLRSLPHPWTVNVPRHLWSTSSGLFPAASSRAASIALVLGPYSQVKVG